MRPRCEIDRGVERIRDATDQPRAHLQEVEYADVSHELVHGNFAVIGRKMSPMMLNHAGRCYSIA